MLVDSNRVEHRDKMFSADVSRERLVNCLFTRLVAKERRFDKVDFRYSIFETSYLRNCVFDSCDFTGCRFSGSNFHGSTFVGCKFDYAVFERTFIDAELLDSSCPGHENLKLRFARSLRMNYQQLGDAVSANKAIGVELQASAVHHFKAWSSNESYYRAKYSGWGRVTAFLRWFDFKVLDLVWGNGESPLKLLRATAVVIALIAIGDLLASLDSRQPISFLKCLALAPQVFFGTASPSEFPPGLLLTAITVSRLIAFGFFMAIVVKRFNRR